MVCREHRQLLHYRRSKGLFPGKFVSFLPIAGIAENPLLKLLLTFLFSLPVSIVLSLILTPVQSRMLKVVMR